MTNQINIKNHCGTHYFSRFSTLLASLILIVVLGGCASTQKNVWVNKDYGGKISELSVRIDPGAVIPHKMSVKARIPKITPQFKTAMIKESNEVIKEMRKLGPACIAGALASHRVDVKDEKDNPSMRLILTPLRIESHSDEYSGVNHKLWYMVVLKENATKKQVWRGEFRMYTAHSRNTTVAISQKELDKFCSDITKSMVDAELLHELSPSAIKE